jgi:hypothetical protein
MKELILDELQFVSGGVACVKRARDLVPCAQTEWGALANDISNAVGDLGSDFGVWVWEVTHPDE